MQGYQINIVNNNRTYCFKWLMMLPQVIETLRQNFTQSEIEQAEISPLTVEEVIKMQAEYAAAIEVW
ncbi:hypothetical protein A0J48_008275 [Sphaerospermopsis aphanizomenoides BCCUSP55]|uniref:hypothetical protein n=1 Tax=Sphaerospermopsis aphanizomenoides TaxID=459663 RepID=UPI00190325F7|nr:hypothetical protein [Sphaerospermopsis aphanizomenoides]MBK1987531.1 hypothetical protein [Sphaerospermopsis aphanizomenoides BCCUSP55]